MPHIEQIGLDAQFRHHGEEVTYLKGGLQGGRAITAIVDRDVAGDTDLGSGVPTPRVQVHVRNDAVKGIAANELDRGKDRISLAWRVGDTVRSFAIINIERQDRGVLVLEVR